MVLFPAPTGTVIFIMVRMEVLRVGVELAFSCASILHTSGSRVWICDSIGLRKDSVQNRS
jgi:hypothetical protein